MSAIIDEATEQLAAEQYGIVTRDQLLARGVTGAAIRSRVRARRLNVRHRGVYQAGPLTVPLSREMAAVLACGTGAFVSHWSAAAIRALRPHPGIFEPVDVTLTGADRGRRPGIRAHRVRWLPEDEVTVFAGIPITTPARTIIDLAPRLSSRDLEQLLATAIRNELTTPDELLAMIDRRPSRRGMRALRSRLEGPASPLLSRSEAEEIFIALMRKGKLPPVRANARVGRFEVDFLWPAEHVIVEIDGFAFHSSRSMFERDRQRDAALTALGFTVVRITWNQLSNGPEAVLVQIAQILGANRRGR